MAMMWPREIPHWIAADPKRCAEIEVYRKLASTLRERWSVYYSRPWWGIGPGGGEVDGEADFIVAHPDKGLLFIEVKGGLVEYDPETSKWTSVNRHKVRSNIKNPVEQAVKSKHRFIEKLKKLPDWPRMFVRARHGVIFPDSDERNADSIYIAGFEKHLFCMASRFRSAFPEWLEERLSPHTPPGSPGELPPGEKVIGLLETIIAKPAMLRVPIGRELTHVLNDQETLLTGQQLAAVTLLESVKRALIVGGAGTGKTLVACEMAARIAKSGNRVCLVCLTEPLALWLTARFRDQSNIDVFSFSELCAGIVSRAGRKFVGQSEHLPDAAMMALGKLASLPWHTFIIDEGQDLPPTSWELIERLVRMNDSSLRVFYDSNQAVYARKDDLETRLQMQSFPLYNNLRNTREIGGLAEQLYEGPKVEARGPVGGPVQFIEGDSHNAVENLTQRLLSLTKHELISVGDIAVLAPTEELLALLGRAFTSARIVWARAMSGSARVLTLETVSRFKGLESPVVLLLVDRRAGNSKETAYVAVSRARARLEIFGPAENTLLRDAWKSSSVGIQSLIDE